jgi:hypothetical protein
MHIELLAAASARLLGFLELPCEGFSAARQSTGDPFGAARRTSTAGQALFALCSSALRGSMLAAMRTNKPASVTAAAAVAVHYGVALCLQVDHQLVAFGAANAVLS